MEWNFKRGVENICKVTILYENVDDIRVPTYIQACIYYTISVTVLCSQMLAGYEPDIAWLVLRSC